MVSFGSSPASGSIGLRLDPDPDERARAGRASERELAADLRRTAAHRFQTEVAGMRSARVEALAIVADLYEDVSLPSLHTNQRPRGVSMLEHIGERLAPDSIKLGLHPAGQRQARPRAPDVDGGQIGGPQARGVSGEC